MAATMGWPQLVVGLVAIQWLAELAVARRNTRRLFAEGAEEAGEVHYPLFMALHAVWLADLFLLTGADVQVEGWLVAVFALLQAGRIWVVASLGRFWTTRVITLPGAPLVRGGPFRWLSHPTYAIAAAELAVLPLAFGRVGTALVYSALNLPLTLHRIRVEEAALGDRRDLTPAGSRAA